jgi:hypothetical protein
MNHTFHSNALTLIHEGADLLQQLRLLCAQCVQLRLHDVDDGGGAVISLQAQSIEQSLTSRMLACERALFMQGLHGRQACHLDELNGAPSEMYDATRLTKMKATWMMGIMIILALHTKPLSNNKIALNFSNCPQHG